MSWPPIPTSDPNHYYRVNIMGQSRRTNRTEFRLAKSAVHSRAIACGEFTVRIRGVVTGAGDGPEVTRSIISSSRGKCIALKKRGVILPSPRTAAALPCWMTTNTYTLHKVAG